jgi:hypothetical protein
MSPIAVQWVLAVMMLLLVGGVAWIALMQIRITGSNAQTLRDEELGAFGAMRRPSIHHVRRQACRNLSRSS